MDDQERLAEIKERRASPHPFLTSEQIDWLVEQAELALQQPQQPPG